MEDIRWQVQDGSQQLLPSDINNYLTSEYANYAEHLLNNVQSVDGWIPTMYNFTRAGNQSWKCFCHSMEQCTVLSSV